MATKYEWIAVYAFAFGVCDGCYEMLLPVITRDIVGVKNVGHAIGALYCLMAFPKTLGPPMVGWIFDASKNYNVSFYVTGGVALIAAIVMYTVNWVKFNDENEERIIRERLLPYNETSGSNQSIQYTWRFKAMGSITNACSQLRPSPRLLFKGSVAHHTRCDSCGERANESVFWLDRTIGTYCFDRILCVSFPKLRYRKQKFMGSWHKVYRIIANEREALRD